jgi:dolichyl-phosphate beta-glucosyltransferase
MYNETKIVTDTIAQLKILADIHPERTFEFIFVNDGSRDDCARIASAEIAGDSRFLITGYTDNRGKGAAVRYGMLTATGDINVFKDCDLAYGTSVICDIVDQMTADGTDVCIGSRNISNDGYEGYTPMRRFMSKTYIKVITLAAGFSHTDSQSGIKCFSAKATKAVFSLCEVNRFAFDLEALIIAERLGYRVSELAVKVINHRESESKVSPVKDTLRMLNDIRNIKKRVKNIKT